MMTVSAGQECGGVRAEGNSRCGLVRRLGDALLHGDECTVADKATYAWGRECGEGWAPLSH